MKRKRERGGRAIKGGNEKTYKREEIEINRKGGDEEEEEEEEEEENKSKNTERWNERQKENAIGTRINGKWQRIDKRQKYETKENGIIE